MYFRYKTTYNWDLDKVKCYYLIPVAFIMAILFHPSLNNWCTDVKKKKKN